MSCAPAELVGSALLVKKKEPAQGVPAQVLGGGITRNGWSQMRSHHCVGEDLDAGPFDMVSIATAATMARINSLFP
jgi:hypothetical protein